MEEATPQERAHAAPGLVTEEAGGGVDGGAISSPSTASTAMPSTSTPTATPSLRGWSSTYEKFLNVKRPSEDSVDGLTAMGKRLKAAAGLPVEISNSNDDVELEAGEVVSNDACAAAEAQQQHAEKTMEADEEMAQPQEEPMSELDKENDSGIANASARATANGHALEPFFPSSSSCSSSSPLDGLPVAPASSSETTGKLTATASCSPSAVDTGAHDLPDSDLPPPNALPDAPTDAALSVTSSPPPAAPSPPPASSTATTDVIVIADAPVTPTPTTAAVTPATPTAAPAIVDLTADSSSDAPAKTDTLSSLTRTSPARINNPLSSPRISRSQYASMKDQIRREQQLHDRRPDQRNGGWNGPPHSPRGRDGQGFRDPDGPGPNGPRQGSPRRGRSRSRSAGRRGRSRSRSAGRRGPPLNGPGPCGPPHEGNNFRGPPMSPRRFDSNGARGPPPGQFERGRSPPRNGFGGPNGGPGGPPQGQFERGRSPPRNGFNGGPGPRSPPRDFRGRPPSPQRGRPGSPGRGGPPPFGRDGPPRGTSPGPNGRRSRSRSPPRGPGGLGGSGGPDFRRSPPRGHPMGPPRSPPRGRPGSPRGGPMGRPRSPRGGPMGRPGSPPRWSMGRPRSPPRGPIGRPGSPPRGPINGPPRSPPRGPMGRPGSPYHGPMMGRPGSPGRGRSPPRDGYRDPPPNQMIRPRPGSPGGFRGPPPPNYMGGGPRRESFGGFDNRGPPPGFNGGGPPNMFPPRGRSRSRSPPRDRNWEQRGPPMYGMDQPPPMMMMPQQYMPPPDYSSGGGSPWIFELKRSGKVKFRCRALPTTIPFPSQLPLSLDIRQLSRMDQYREFLALDRGHVQRIVYEMRPETLADKAGYEEFRMYLLQGRSDGERAGVSMDLDRVGYRVFVLPPGAAARSLGYKADFLVAVIRRRS